MIPKPDSVYLNSISSRYASIKNTEMLTRDASNPKDLGVTFQRYVVHRDDTEPPFHRYDGEPPIYLVLSRRRQFEFHRRNCVVERLKMFQTNRIDFSMRLNNDIYEV